jgi:hypothetical protein
MDKITRLLSQPNVAGPLTLIVLLYGSDISLRLPVQGVKLFQNKYFKFVSMVLILLSLRVNVYLAVAMILVFTMSVNAANNQPLWEFLDNVEDTTPGVVTSPTTEIGVDSAAVSLEDSVTQPSQVNGMMQNDTTTTIQPSIIETESGPIVVNPSVVIAPLAVTKPSGEVVMVKPDITFVNAEPVTTSPTRAPEPIFAPELIVTPTEPNKDLEIRKPGEKCEGLDYYFKSSVDMKKVKPTNLGGLDGYSSYKMK